jgi:hypothetical protein
MAEVLNHIALVVLFLSFISSLNAFRLDMPVPFKQFSFFLLFTTLGEYFAYAWANGLNKLTAYDNTNQWFYNLFHIPLYLFLFYFFYRILHRPGIKRIIPVLAGLYFVFAVINLCFIQGILLLNSYSELLGSSMMIFLSLAYYYQLLMAKEVISVKRDPGFWISTGVFISYIGSILAISLINIMISISRQKAVHFMTFIILSGILAYLTFSMAFLCYKRKR